MSARVQLTAPGQLTAANVDAAGPGARLNDGGGLLLLSDAKTGHKVWRFRYRWEGRDALMSLGAYPAVSLDAARAAAAQHRESLAAGNKPAGTVEPAPRVKTFGTVAAEYLTARAKDRDEKTMVNLRRMAKYCEPLNVTPLDAVTHQTVLGMCEQKARDNQHETARKLGQFVRGVYDYARARGYTERDNPGANVGKSLSLIGHRKPKDKSFAAVTDPDTIGLLMREVQFQHDFGATHAIRATTSAALNVLARTVVRVNELLGAQWSEFDLDGALPQHKGQPTWVIPRDRMKGGKGSDLPPHIVPLSRQCVAILREQRQRATGPVVFPSPGTMVRAMTENGVRKALIALGFGETDGPGRHHTPHGFRTMFSTLTREVLHADNDVIERQLAHKVGDAVRGAYDRSQLVEKRRELMQAYSDLLDTLRDKKTAG